MGTGCWKGRPKGGKVWEWVRSAERGRLMGVKLRAPGEGMVWERWKGWGMALGKAWVKRGPAQVRGPG